MIATALMYASQDKDLGLIDLKDAIADARVTFTRAGNRTYHDAAGVLQTAGTDVWPREFDLATGVCLGRSCWAAATNRALWNRDFTNAVWVKTNVTAAKDQTGVDGSANAASSLTATAGNGTVLQSVTSASATRRTTCYVKRVTGSGTIEMTQDGGGTWSAVTVTGSYSRVGPASAVVTNPQIGFRIVTSGDAIAVDFFQLENSSDASPATPTTSANVTRPADVATISTLSSIGFNASEGAIIFEGTVLDNSTTRSLAEFSDGTSAERIQVYASSSSAVVRYGIVDGGASQGDFSGGSIVMGTPFRFACAYKLNDMAASLNGAAVVTDTSATMPTVDRLKVGMRYDNATQMNGYISKILYLPRRITNAELQAASKL